MPKKIVECVPNFSEGRRMEVVDAIVAAITDTPGVVLLNRTSDPDHHRSVVTFAGSPDAALEAAFQSIRKAADLIDMSQHKGVHPRLGATDVVPFVPIQNVAMEGCVQLAHRLGWRVGEELGIPVYFYEAAATRPDRANLADVRRGEYETLVTEIKNNPDRAPDCGPAELGSAGATIIGARKPLIAYNVYLTTDDVKVARKIARTIRFSSGGLPHVKALGLPVDGRAQVSINLTDYQETPIYLVVQRIREEAKRYGVSIHHTELVGLIPQDALFEAARYYLQIKNFTPNLVLEPLIYKSQANINNPD